MRKFISIILSALSLGAFAGEIKTPAFSLMLNGDWAAEHSSDPEQFSYYSKSQDVGITTSFTLMKAKPSDTERIALKLKEFRLAAEDKAAQKFNIHPTIAEPIVVPFSKGHQVAYYGHDNQGRQFRYLGIVTPSKTVNIYAESRSRTQQDLEAIFNNLLKGLSL